MWSSLKGKKIEPKKLFIDTVYMTFSKVISGNLLMV